MTTDQAARDNLMRELVEALQAIVAECSPGQRPYSTDSYLPEHLLEQARAALSKATGEQQ